MKKYLIIGLVTLTGCSLLDNLFLPEKANQVNPQLPILIQLLMKALARTADVASTTTTYGGIAIGVLSSIWIAIRGHRIYKKIKNGKTKNGNGSPP